MAQNTLLLNGTVAENIAYGQADATEAEIKKAAIAARAEEFIEKLPDGYDTLIGDQGVRKPGQLGFVSHPLEVCGEGHLLGCAPAPGVDACDEIFGVHDAPVRCSQGR